MKADNNEAIPINDSLQNARYCSAVIEGMA